MIKRIFFIFLILAVPAFAASISSVWVEPCLVVKGENCTIRWQSNGSTDDAVNITVWLGNTQAGEILNIPNASGNNEKVWPVPASLATGKYIFRVMTVNGLFYDQAEYLVDQKGIVVWHGPSGSVKMGSTVGFDWHGFGYPYVAITTYHDLYRSGTLVGRIGVSGMSVNSGCGLGSTWVVGDLVDPTTGLLLDEKAPVGSGYKIRVSDVNFFHYGESEPFSIYQPIDPAQFKDRLRRISRIPVLPGGCPMCGEVQLSDILEIIRTTPEAHAVELWHAGRSLGKLIESKIVRGDQSLRRIDFGNSFQQLKQGGSGFELRVFDNKGKLLLTQAVVLNYQAR